MDWSVLEVEALAASRARAETVPKYQTIPSQRIVRDIVPGCLDAGWSITFHLRAFEGRLAVNDVNGASGWRWHRWFRPLNRPWQVRRRTQQSALWPSENRRGKDEKAKNFWASCVPAFPMPPDC